MSQLSLLDTLAKFKISISPDFGVGIVRDKSFWFVGREIEIGGVTAQIAHFGDWREGKVHTWSSANTKGFSKEDKKKFDTENQKVNAELEKARGEEWEIVAKDAEELWKQATPHGEHPYLQRKNLASLHGARIFIQEQGHSVLLVPMRDVQGKLWNITRIYSKKFVESGSDKFLMTGGRKTALFHLMGTIQNESTVYITEGYATGASVHEATGRAPTVVAFDAGNLLPVAKDIRDTYPKCKLVFCADNDLWTKSSTGVPYNPGREKALRAASETKGNVVLPRFTERELELRATDFNDVHVHMGLNEVTEQIMSPDKQVQDVVPLTPVGKGKQAKTSEKDICTALLDHFEDRILKYEKDLFTYRDGYWHLLGEPETNKIKQLICKLAPEYGSRDCNSAFSYFLIHCPPAPQGINLFQPTPFAANFENGTLHVNREGKDYKAEFRPHSKSDYLTAKLPFDFPGIPGTESYKQSYNEEFDKMLRRIWDGDPDQSEKIRLYKQVLGACLIPLFPIITIFVGPTRTGKSTLLKLLSKLVSFENVSNIDPSEFHGFNMETMVGKLININTDIDLIEPMKDSMVKKIIDRQPVEIKRKFQKAVKAFLPGLHAFAANDLPQTLDGQSKAYAARMIIIRTDKFQPEAGHDLDFDNWVWEQGPGGIICAAVEGLFDLLNQKGHYHRPSSGKALVEEMQNRNDPVAMFLDEIRYGEMRDDNTIIVLEPNKIIKRSTLWLIFKTWRDDQDQNTRKMGRTQFFRAMAAKGYTPRKSIIQGGEFWYHGVGAIEAPKSNY